MNVYISNFNLQKILKSIKQNSNNISKDYPCYPVDVPFLNPREKSEASLYRLFISNTQEFIDKYYLRMKDTMTFVSERPPAFHSSKDCPLLYSKFENVFIPNQIKLRAQEDKHILEDFRKWCIQHNELFQRNRLAFIAQCCIAFKLNETEFRRVERDNVTDNSVIKDNYNLVALQNKVDNLISKFNEEINSSSLKLKVYQEFKHRIFLGLPDKEIYTQNTGFSNKEVKDVLFDWYNNFVTVGKDLIIECLRIQFNPELSFEGNLYEQLGFLPCKSCCRDYVATVKVDFYNFEKNE